MSADTAAPDLLTALKLGYYLSRYTAAIKWSDRETNTAEFLKELRRLIEEFQPIAEAAIAKAEGRSSCGKCRMLGVLGPCDEHGVGVGR